MPSRTFPNWAAANMLAMFALLSIVVPVWADGPFTEAEVKKLAVAVTMAAHPTAKNPALIKYSEPKKDGFFLIKLEVEYNGAVLKNRYTADALVEIQPPKTAGDPLEITRIDFVDRNNSVAPNQKNLKKLIEDMNARLRIDKAK